MEVSGEVLARLGAVENGVDQVKQTKDKKRVDEPFEKGTGKVIDGPFEEGTGKVIDGPFEEGTGKESRADGPFEKGTGVGIVICQTGSRVTGKSLRRTRPLIHLSLRVGPRKERLIKLTALSSHLKQNQLESRELVCAT